MSSPEVTGQLWLFRTKPQEDELFSSWLVRLASGLALRLQTFTTQVLGLHAGYWTGDVDRQLPLQVVHRLSQGTAVSGERIVAMGLSGYEGRLWENYRSLGPMAWLTPIGRNGRHRLRHGQQYCRLCLEEDDHPYFRRKWRLAFNVVCERHNLLLEDACPHCLAPVEFHAGDFGQRLLGYECPIVQCGLCKGDFRCRVRRSDPVVSRSVLEVQRLLNAALKTGWHSALPGARSYSHLHFVGLRHLIRLLCSAGHAKRLRQYVLGTKGMLDFGLQLGSAWQKYEALRVGERAFILDCAAQLLRDWPSEFIESCVQSRVSSSYILDYPNTLPYWLASDVEWYLDDRDYAPCPEERAAVEDYLARHNLPVSKNSVNCLLGVASVSSLIRKHTTRQRWNPRGPRSSQR